MTASENFQLPILDRLIRDGVPRGLLVLVEYDPDSICYSFILTLTAGALRQGYSVDFTCCEHEPQLVREDLEKLGVDVSGLSAGEIPKLRFIDGYSAAIGRESKERFAFPSMSIADHSIDVLLAMKERPQDSKWRDRRIGICENLSVLLQHNPEKAVIGFYATRLLPFIRLRGKTHIQAYVKGIHSDQFYRSMESFADAIIDMKLDTSGDVPTNLLRVRSYKKGKHDAKWYPIQIGDNFAVII